MMGEAQGTSARGTPVADVGRRRHDPTVVWSVTLHVLSLPLMLVLLVVVGLVASSWGIELGSDQDLAAQRLLIGGYAVAVALPLAASLIIGIVGWRRRRRRSALAAAGVSAAVLAFFLLIVVGALI